MKIILKFKYGRLCALINLYQDCGCWWAGAQYETFMLNKRWWISWLGKQVLASQKGLLKFVGQYEFHYVSRELRDSRHKFEILSHDLKGKEAQIKELQSKLESGEGCKYIIFCIPFIAIAVKTADFTSLWDHIQWCKMCKILGSGKSEKHCYYGHLAGTVQNMGT